MTDFLRWVGGLVSGTPALTWFIGSVLTATLLVVLRKVAKQLRLDLTSAVLWLPL